MGKLHILRSAQVHCRGPATWRSWVEGGELRRPQSETQALQRGCSKGPPWEACPGRWGTCYAVLVKAGMGSEPP